ncbi:hypothetical protein [Rhodococcus opacus]|uniref:hypothetical protein n=1 Tax=Rhodococcus opacus TaxID=37919 RepID=UPI0027D24964|nr:hypothetical protein [Rhodococcus opacus]
MFSGDISAAQPGDLLEPQPGGGQREEEGIAAAEQTARPPGHRNPWHHLRHPVPDPGQPVRTIGVEQLPDRLRATRRRQPGPGVNGIDRGDPAALRSHGRRVVAEELRQHRRVRGQRSMLAR